MRRAFPLLLSLVAVPDAASAQRELGSKPPTATSTDEASDAPRDEVEASPSRAGAGEAEAEHETPIDGVDGNETLAPPQQGELLDQPPQDYDTRRERPPTPPEQARGWAEPPSTEPEDVYLFLPRLVLYPPNLVLKLVAIPIRGAAILIDRYYVIEHIKDILYNDARTAGVLPSFSYQSGYGLTYGLKAFHNDLFGNDEELDVAASYGGILLQGYGMSFIGDQIAHTPLWVEARASYEAKPALFFHGIGNEPVSDPSSGVAPREAAVATRYRENRAMGKLTVGTSIGDEGDRSHVGVTGLFNHRNFGSERRDFPEPSIEEIYDTSQIPGFDDGSDVLEVTPTFVYDSRDNEATTSRGVYLDLFGGHTVPIDSRADFWHYGAALATFINLYQGTRVLSVRGVLEAVHGRDDEIPFADLIKLGGPNSLRGYQLDRFRDKVSALATLEYRYPVHEMVSGELFLDVGRVGRGYTDIFNRQGLDDFHYGGGLGFVFHRDDKIFFKAEAAYGEELLFFLSTDPLRTFRRRDKRL